MLLIPCFLPLFLILKVVCQDDSPELRRFQNHLRLFRDVLNAKNEHTRLDHQQEDNSPARPALYPPSASRTPERETLTEEPRFSILPIGTLPPPVVQTEIVRPAVTVTSVIEVPKPIEPGLLEEIIKSVLQQHLNTKAEPTPTSMAELSSYMDPPPDTVMLTPMTFMPTPSESLEELPMVTGIETETLTYTADFVNAQVLELRTLTDGSRTVSPKNGMMKQIAGIKGGNKIHIRPQFRHHKTMAPALGGTYAKPKTAWYGNYARKPRYTPTPTAIPLTIEQIEIQTTQVESQTTSTAVSEISETLIGNIYTDVGRIIQLLREQHLNIAEVVTNRDLSRESMTAPGEATALTITQYLPTSIQELETSQMASSPSDVPSDRVPESLTRAPSHRILKSLVGFPLKRPATGVPNSGKVTMPAYKTAASFSPILKNDRATRGRQHTVPIYDTARPRTPEEILNSRKKPTKPRTTHFFDVFANTAVPPSCPLAIGMLVFAFFVAFL